MGTVATSEPDAPPAPEPGPTAADVVGDTIGYVSGEAPAALLTGFAPLERGARVGRYLVIDRIGAGGMGVVYAAYDPDLDRRVALKLLGARARLASSVSLARLLREAQAMARLQHPNVITVHDVGTFHDQVFLAMELVEGPSLGRWAAEAPRSWREVLEVYLQAARGLEAIHAAGLVHRDFKPDNALLGRDGRVRVLDLGLVRLSQTDQDPPPSGEESTRPGQPPPPLASELTQAGAIVGTPAYMSPEQLAGEPADARSDQFSFCAALYEALHGERPFAGATPVALLREIRAGHVRPPGAGQSVPTWIRRALLRGLHGEAGARHESMGALVAALTHRPGMRRRRTALGALLAGIAVLAVVLGVVAWRHQVTDRALVCQQGGRRIAGIWSADRARAVEAAFTGPGRPYAAASAQSAIRLLDDYARTWTDMQRAACVATRVDRAQSEDILALRTVCLERRLREVSSLVDLFASADASVVERAVSAAHGLSPVAECGDIAALTARVPLAPLAMRPRVEEIRGRLARAKELRDLGRYADGLAVARAGAEDAEKTRYRAVEAEALWLRGDLEQRVGMLKASEQTLNEAVWAAESGQHDEIAVRASVVLAYVTGSQQSQAETGHRWYRFAEAALDRLGRRDDLAAHLLNNQGLVFEAEGKDAIALEYYRRSLLLYARALPPGHPHVAQTHYNLGRLFTRLARYEEACKEFESTLPLQVQALGPDHPAVGWTRNAYGDALRWQGKHAEALAQLNQSLAILERALGPQHPDLGWPLGNLGIALQSQGRFEEALAMHGRALALREQGLGADHPLVSATLGHIGLVLADQGRYREAINHFRTALSALEARLGPSHPEVANTLANLCHAQVRKGDFPGAKAACERALAISEHAYGTDHPQVADALTGLGEARVGSHQAASAIPLLQRAARIFDRDGDPDERARARFALARALWDGGDRQRAGQLALEARDLYRSTGPAGQGRAHDPERWLAAHTTR